MHAYVGGDVAAFRSLFERWTPSLLRVFWTAGPTEAQDLVQHTFLLLHRARRDFHGDAPLRPWLLTIALNVLREHWRKQRRRPVVQLEREPVAEDSGQDARIEQNVRDAALRAALARLPRLQREVIMLHWFEDLGFAEIAEIVGATPGAVRVRAFRGYEQLRACFGGDANERAREATSNVLPGSNRGMP